VVTEPLNLVNLALLLNPASQVLLLNLENQVLAMDLLLVHLGVLKSPEPAPQPVLLQRICLPPLAVSPLQAEQTSPFRQVQVRQMCLEPAEPFHLLRLVAQMRRPSQSQVALLTVARVLEYLHLHLHLSLPVDQLCQFQVALPTAALVPACLHLHLHLTRLVDQLHHFQVALQTAALVPGYPRQLLHPSLLEPVHQFRAVHRTQPLHLNLALQNHLPPAELCLHQLQVEVPNRHQSCHPLHLTQFHPQLHLMQFRPQLHLSRLQEPAQGIAHVPLMLLPLPHHAIRERERNVARARRVVRRGRKTLPLLSNPLLPVLLHLK
jgi:hypothetical protein